MPCAVRSALLARLGEGCAIWLELQEGDQLIECGGDCTVLNVNGDVSRLHDEESSRSEMMSDEVGELMMLQVLPCKLCAGDPLVAAKSSSFLYFFPCYLRFVSLRCFFGLRARDGTVL